MWRRAGPHLFLSDLVPGDVPRLVEYLADGAIARLTTRVPHPYGEAQAREFLSFADAERAKAGHEVVWAIRDEEASLLGVIGITPLPTKEDEPPAAELGYWVGLPHQRKGVATAAVKRAIEVAFHEWEIDVLIAYVQENNSASEKVLEKNGFAREDKVEQYAEKHGVPVSAWRYRKVYEE